MYYRFASLDFVQINRIVVKQQSKNIKTKESNKHRRALEFSRVLQASRRCTDASMQANRRASRREMGSRVESHKSYVYTRALRVHR